MLFKWTIIRKDELSALRRTAALVDRAVPSMLALDRLGQNPATRRKVLCLLREDNPDLLIPEIDGIPKYDA
jgi:hypothetical protein